MGFKMRTPSEDVKQRLSVPLGCGWKGCENVMHGIQPFPEEDNMQQWEMCLSNHDKVAKHPYRILREDF